MILIYPILTRIIGLENFGKVMVANALAGLLGILVNYGTIQTSIKDVATFRENKQLLSEVFWNTFSIRLLIFSIVILIILFSFFLANESYLFYLFALPLVLAEVLNPMFFFLGVERLKILNLANLFSKALTLVLIILLIKSGENSIYVNFLMGIILSLTYLFTIIWAIRKYKLKFMLPSRLSQLLILEGNFYLLANNFVVHLQQSLMLFILQGVKNALWLGAYALCDKVIWSTRLLIISLTSSIYPKSTRLYNESRESWLNFKKKSKFIFGALFLVISVFIFLFADLIIRILAGEENGNASIYLKQMAFAPFLAALNCMNVIDRLVANDNYTIFKIAIIILIVAVSVSLGLVSTGSFQIIGFYMLVVELISLLLYEFFTRKYVVHV